jgi:ferredoxin
MMQDLIGVLTALGVPREAIHTEAFFSGGSSRTRRERAHALTLAAAASGATAYTIGVAGSERDFPCLPGRTVLEAANTAGVPLAQSCGEGSCGTCRVRALAGTFETDSRGMFSAAELSTGWLLACQTLPTSDMTISTEAF